MIGGGRAHGEPAHRAADGYSDTSTLVATFLPSRSS